MSLFKGMKPPKNMDRWKGMESWLRIHYFDHLDTSSKSQEEENTQKEEENSSLLHARFVVCILNGAGATPVGLEADLEVILSSYNVDITIVAFMPKFLCNTDLSPRCLIIRYMLEELMERMMVAED